MTREELKRKLQNKALREQFNYEVKEREAIMSEKEGEFQNTNALAFDATVQAWMLKDLDEVSFKTSDILEIFNSDKCICGNSKKSRTSHCRDCYFSLPQTLRNELYKPFYEGYQDAFRESVKYLSDKSIIKSKVC